MNTQTLNTTLIAVLPDITEVAPMSENDKPCLNEIMSVLKKHNALGRFGLTLLHQHFDIAEDEILCESVDVAGKTQTIRPIKKTELANFDYTETSWRMDNGTVMMACVCVKFGNDHSHQSRG